jgi:uncharacterized metal-binding protein YceD (DUF177 family)
MLNMERESKQRLSQAGGGEFRRLIRLDELGRKDVERTLNASAEECGALARRFEVAEILTLEAFVRVQRTAAGVFTVTGTLEADIVFIGEETDEAMDFTVNEPVEEVFVTEQGWESLREASVDGEVDAELLSDEMIDLGEAVAQNLSLALDPLLLEAGALEAGAVTYTAGGEDEDDKPEHPFARLAVLRGPDEPADGSADA